MGHSLPHHLASAWSGVRQKAGPAAPGLDRLGFAENGHRPDGIPQHARPVTDSCHISGLMPSFSTYMKFPVTLPSSPFGPERNTAAPGFSRLLSPGTGARI